MVHGVGECGLDSRHVLLLIILLFSPCWRDPEYGCNFLFVEIYVYSYLLFLENATDKTEWRCITFFNCVQVVVMTRDKTHPKLPSRTKGDFF